MTTRNERNRYDRKDSLELGEKAENIFARTALKRGWKLTQASSHSNINEHWDFLMARGAEEYRVDVKAMKRVSRGDPGVQDAWAWIELHGVRDYDRGWLYGGKAELIAFETRKSFVIVRRGDLIKLIEKLVDRKIFAQSAREARYKVYSRPGRPDIITMVETAKLRAIAWAEWAKG